MRARVLLDATQHLALTLVLGIFKDASTERRLVGEFTGMTVEIAAGPLGHRAGEAPGGDEIMPAIARRQHGKGGVSDTSDVKTVAAAAEFSFRERVSLRG